ncbi:hypothetical protein AAC387_Pa04g2816 [Persea americana]
MAVISRPASFILVLACVFTVSEATMRIVGGSNHWRFGFNYSAWALTNAPIYQNDTLVFMYDPPNSTTFPHSVYLLRNHNSFKACDLKRAKLVADTMQGCGRGFKFVLMKRKHYYFACGERGGFHCSAGLMKFYVKPLLPTCNV